VENRKEKLKQKENKIQRKTEKTKSILNSGFFLFFRYNKKKRKGVNMRAIVTGASSGIGRDMARYLAKLGYDLIIVARDKEKLEKLQKELEKKDKKVDIFIVDLADEDACKKFHKEVKEKYETVDMLINNAGFGLFGEFEKTDLDTEISMIKTNVIAVHILTKLFLQDMRKKDKGMILNVGSIAGFLPGPLMTTYYSTKNYVYRFTESIQHELRKEKSNIVLSVLCPGPVKTNFNQVAKVKFNLKERESEDIAKYAIDQFLKKKKIIVPGFDIKMARFFSKIIPDRILMIATYHSQKKKR